jgi:tetratricopeptide (TPR) repeat protein
MALVSTATEARSTGAVEVRMVLLQSGATLRQRVAQRIDWPDWQTRSVQAEVDGRSDDAVVATAVGLIDQGSDHGLRHARELLERVIARNPRADAAYVELARVTMKSNWSPEGLHQAETLIASALQIRPDSANARILLAYVEAHQQRYAEASALFQALDKENPDNLWLWWNWGEMLQAQGKRLAAVDKFRRTLSHPVTHDPYDRARLAAYDSLIQMQDAQGDLDGVEALYRQRLADYGTADCSAVAYARFLALRRGDAAAAIDMARRALSDACRDDGPPARSVLGVAYYMAWASSTAADRDAALNQARVYLPMGAQALYLLASSDRTLPAARALTRQGEPVDQRDNGQMTALALALENNDLDAARRLIGLGASPVAAVGPQSIPAAFLPIAAGSKAGIRLLQQHGVNYSTLRYRGASAAELARRAGRGDLAELLDARESAL